jgi:hypothetical protein
MQNVAEKTKKLSTQMNGMFKGKNSADKNK